jgi:PKD repeat protein
MRRLNCTIAVIVPAALLTLVLAVGVPQAQAVVVQAAPTWPIANAVAGPPPIAALPTGGDTTPPADQIADPVTAAAVCGGWYRQSNYGDRWPAGSSWWEYRCTREDTFYSNPCTSGACDAFCWYCYWETQAWYDVTLTVTDSGGATGAVTKSVTLNPLNVPPTAGFTFGCTGLGCSFNGAASADSDGAIASYSWAFGDGATASGVTAAHTYGHSGSYSASLTVTDDRGASTTVAKEVAVTNLAPTAAFVVACSSLHCTLDASGSADRDGTIASYGWNFGDGNIGTVTTTSTTHDYPKAGNYTVTLTVTDNDGASASTPQRINPISLSARAYKQSGQQKVDLAWTGVAGTSFDVYRNGAKIATVSTTTYTDTVGKATGSYGYKVCEPASATCSNEATVSF